GTDGIDAEQKRDECGETDAQKDSEQGGGDHGVECRTELPDRRGWSALDVIWLATALNKNLTPCAAGEGRRNAVERSRVGAAVPGRMKLVAALETGSHLAAKDPFPCKLRGS